MPIGPRRPWKEDLHPRGFGGKWGHGTGTAQVPVGKAGRAAAKAKYSAKDVTSGGATTRPPVAAQKEGFWKFGPVDPNEGPVAKARRLAAQKVADVTAKKKAAAEKKATPAPAKKATPKTTPKAVAPAVPKPKPQKPPKPRKLRKGETVTTGEQNDAAKGEHPDWVIRRSTSDGKNVRIADDVAALSNPEDIERERNDALDKAQQDAALTHATKIFTEGVTKGPAIRAAIREVVAEQGGRMGREYDPVTGEPTAVKTEHSTFRKVQDKMIVDGKPAVEVALADAVRFTAVFNEDNYVESVDALRATLEEAGFTRTQPPPGVKGAAWALGAYRGLNMNFTDETGTFTFEVQAHTPTSLDVADHDAHKLYEVFRKKGKDFQKLMDDKGPHGAHAMTGINPEGLTPNAYRQQISEKMHDVADKIPVPKGVTIIKAKDEWDEVVKVADKTGNFSSRDASEILRKKPGPRALLSDKLSVKKLTDAISARFTSDLAQNEDFQGIGKRWYPGALASVNQFIEGTDYTPAQGAAIVAAFSPNTGWAQNMKLAERFIKGESLADVKLDGDGESMKGDGAGTLKANIARAERVRDMVDVTGKSLHKTDKKTGEQIDGDPIEALTGNDPYGTMKIVSFQRNIMGDHQAVTVDRHAMRAGMTRLASETVQPGDEKKMVTVPTGTVKERAAGKTKTITRAAQKEQAFADRAGTMLGRKGTYAKVAQAYRAAAAKHGVSPAEMQAIVWGQIRGTYG